MGAERMAAERAIMRTGAMEVTPGTRGELQFEEEEDEEEEVPELRYTTGELAQMSPEERVLATGGTAGQLLSGEELSRLQSSCGDLEDPFTQSPPSPLSNETTAVHTIEEYPALVVERLLLLLCRYPTCRTITIQVAATILLELVRAPAESKCEYPLLRPKHWSLAQRGYSLARSFLRNRVYGTMANVLLEIFEAEVKSFMDTDVLVNTVAQQGQMNRMVRGSFLLLPPGSAATANLELSMREPASELEITRKAIQVFLLARRLVHELEGKADSALPLKRVSGPGFEVDDPIDLTDQDVIACGVKTSAQMRPVSRYIVIHESFLVIVDPDPDPKKMSWAFVRVVHPLQYVEARATRADPRILQVAMRNNQNKQEVMHLVFDDQSVVFLLASTLSVDGQLCRRR